MVTLMAKKKIRKSQPRGRRQTGSRPLKKKVSFCAEEKSEEQYIKALIQKRYNSEIAVKFWRQRNRSSLKELIDRARKRANEEDTGEGIWIVCDSDENQSHIKPLINWLEEAPEHRHAAVTEPCLEHWLLLHYVDSPDCNNAADAERKLKKHLSGYEKGSSLPDALIDATDEAVRRQALAGTTGAWSTPQISQMRDLITWLDALRHNR